jgi:TolA-binding protein
LCVHAAHRQAGESFVVVSGEIRVKVVGTHFSVTRQSADVAEVAVSEGRVEAAHKNGRTFTVDANRRLRVGPDDDADFQPIRDDERRLIETLFIETEAPVDDAQNTRMLVQERETAREPVAAMPFKDTDPFQNTGAPSSMKSGENQVEQWRSWILDGRLDDAKTALLFHVKKRPKDGAAWSLLADCYRKTGEWQSALTALNEVESLGNSADVLRAQFRAGVILQDYVRDPAAAAKKLRSYVESKDGPLKAEASVRLAVSYVALNKRADARVLLESVVRDHSGTTAAETAQKMLLDL